MAPCTERSENPREKQRSPVCPVRRCFWQDNPLFETDILPSERPLIGGSFSLILSKFTADSCWMQSIAWNVCFEQELSIRLWSCDSTLIVSCTHLNIRITTPRKKNLRIKYSNITSVVKRDRNVHQHSSYSFSLKWVRQLIQWNQGWWKSFTHVFNDKNKISIVARKLVSHCSKVAIVCWNNILNMWFRSAL